MKAQSGSAPAPLTQRAVFFDCFSGASGDMILGALVDAGLDVELLRSELLKLRLDGWRLEAKRVAKGGLAGTQVRVHVDALGPAERTLGDVERIIRAGELDTEVQERALQIFTSLAVAEGRVHGAEPDQVHFHDVGAVDAMVDVVGAVIGLRSLKVEQVYASGLPLALGSVETAHGRLPLPAPATLELIAQGRVPTRPVAEEGELVTPTGAAILTTLAEFRQPAMTVETVGTGVGVKDFPWPNVLRLWLGSVAADELYTGEVAIIETNLDDSSPEQLAFAMERLLEAGALDVFFTPVQMKKNRPGVVLTVLAPPAEAHALARVVLRETSSLGVRFRAADRLMAPRRNGTVSTAFGRVQVKVKTIDGEDVVAPEYEDCARVARERGIPIAAVYAEVLRSASRIE